MLLERLINILLQRIKVFKTLLLIVANIVAIKPDDLCMIKRFHIINVSFINEKKKITDLLDKLYLYGVFFQCFRIIRLRVYNICT